MHILKYLDRSKTLNIFYTETDCSFATSQLTIYDYFFSKENIALFDCMYTHEHTHTHNMQHFLFWRLTLNTLDGQV